MRLESQMLNEIFNNIPVEQETEDDDTIAYTSGSDGKPLLALMEKEFDLNKLIMKFYRQDKIYSKILENPKAHAKFGVKEGFIFTKNNLSRDVICISVKLSRSLSDCRDSIQSKIDPLPLLQLCSNHPPDRKSVV